jgi:hypothetical protein
MNTSTKLSLLTASIAISIVVAGCSSNGFRIAPVSGVVILNGEPLPKASMVFQPAAKGNPGPPSPATIDEAGRFTLAFVGKKAGAVVGKHTVIVSTRQFGVRKDNPDAEQESSKNRFLTPTGKTRLNLKFPLVKHVLRRLS